MKNLKQVLATVICTVLLWSCGGGASKQDANAEGFEVIERVLNDKFGNNAHYTDLTITYNESIGNIIGVIVTDVPESMKMGQWSHSQDTWTQTSEIVLEVPRGTKAADFMFQLDDNINLKELGELVEKSKTLLSTEKGIENPSLHMAFIKMPKNGDRIKIEYVVMLRPKNDGTTFTFSYDLKGTLINTDY